MQLASIGWKVRANWSASLKRRSPSAAANAAADDELKRRLLDSFEASQTERELSPHPEEQIYEYACHETNYAMEGILRGARKREAQTAK